MADNILARYGYGYVPPQFGDSEDYSTQNVLAAYSRPRQGPIANALGIDPTVERDTILPFATVPGKAQTAPADWKSSSDVMRSIDGGWRFAAPQFLVDAINTADRVGTAPVVEPYARTDENRESMTEAAGAVVGPQVAAGFIRNALTPRGGSELGIFGGRLAQNAPLSKLEMAEWMTQSGAPREQVWKETGWFKGVDGKWRFEIDDSGANFAADKVRGSFDVVPAEKVIDHPSLYEAYPDTRKIGIGSEFGDGAGYRARGGFFDRMLGVGKENISLGDEAAPTSYLHELQHGIQRREGTSTGGSPTRRLDFDTYQRLSGETEARAVERRANLTPEQRAARPPWLDYDVPESQQIVRFDGRGPQLSAPRNALAPEAVPHTTPHTVVPFDDQLSNILRKYGLLPPAVAGALAASNPDQAQARQ